MGVGNEKGEEYDSSIYVTFVAWTTKRAVWYVFVLKVNVILNKNMKTKLSIDFFCSYMKDILAIIISTLYDQYNEYFLNIKMSWFLMLNHKSPFHQRSKIIINKQTKKKSKCNFWKNPKVRILLLCWNFIYLILIFAVIFIL